MGGVCSRKNRNWVQCSTIKLDRSCKPVKKQWDTKAILSTVPESNKHEFRQFIKKGIHY